MPPQKHAPSPSRAAFRTTRWSMVLSAGEPSSREAAVEDLANIYWAPVYAYLRRSGWAAHDAEDLTQGFMAHLISGDRLSWSDPSKCRFRTFVLTALKQYLTQEHRRRSAIKRGHDRVVTMAPEELANLEAASSRLEGLPEQAYLQSWGRCLLGSVLEKLQSEYEAAGKADLYGQLAPFLNGNRDLPSHKALGQQLDLSESAIRMAIHRLRRRYRDLLFETIGDTVENPDEIPDEINFLFSVFAT